MPRHGYRFIYQWCPWLAQPLARPLDGFGLGHNCPMFQRVQHTAHSDDGKGTIGAFVLAQPG